MLTLVLAAACALSIYWIWESRQEFVRVFSNGTNVDDDEAAFKAGIIQIGCGVSFFLSLAALIGTWVRPSDNEAGGSR